LFLRTAFYVTANFKVEETVVQTSGSRGSSSSSSSRKVVEGSRRSEIKVATLQGEFNDFELIAKYI